MENTHQVENKTNYVNLKFKKPKPLTIAIGAVIILIVIALFFFKGHFVAATVNGSPISRLSIIKKLEKQGGQQILDTIIAEKLIDDEAKKKGIIVEEDEISGEFQVIKSQIASMGSTLEDQLKEQGMTEQDLKDNLTRHLKMEKILADKIQVTEQEVDAHIKDNKVSIPKGTEIEARTKIKEQMKENKVNQFSQQLVLDLKSQAKVKYYVNY